MIFESPKSFPKRKTNTKVQLNIKVNYKHISLVQGVLYEANVITNNLPYLSSLHLGLNILNSEFHSLVYTNLIFYGTACMQHCRVIFRADTLTYASQ